MWLKCMIRQVWHLYNDHRDRGGAQPAGLRATLCLRVCLARRVKGEFLKPARQVQPCGHAIWSAVGPAFKTRPSYDAEPLLPLAGCCGLPSRGGHPPVFTSEAVTYLLVPVTTLRFPVASLLWCLLSPLACELRGRGDCLFFFFFFTHFCV